MSEGRRVPSAEVCEGLAIVDKPAGPTSHDVVARVRRLVGTRRVGHAGTLDPSATGVLVLGIGRGTKLLTYLVGADKTYAATIRLGIDTVTDDAAGEPLRRPGVRELGHGRILEQAVLEQVAALTGPLQQVPSAVSAVKVDGRRAYDRVRSGEQVDLPARPVTVSRFEVSEFLPGLDGDLPVLDLRVEVDCSSGTYIRALARDLGSSLCTGGHLTALRRTRVGRYHVEDAVALPELPGRLDVVPLAQAAEQAFGVRRLSAEEAVRLGHGQRLPAEGLGPGPVAALAPDGSLVALVGERSGSVRPLLVLAR
ncbi:MAG: tRNA pseudouridine55 synthase [Actinomycetota bacterium]|nr:tRNA pseudouridine55 synthase [Actinomycetota bacterium]